ncbi:MAG: hypothetical protein AVDCRST_MAG50-746 [uncultured Acidimicrobiales bacterium]|uniref:DUF3153 domain-containing protein n=1 Tax=uncultured Acidimicrobiales bacterium TaxID=310071 RepID=A0A6J4HGY0_9ACTN|nr:MAG: hypothetical protein AVDCRST_MAG50-746 [uncultured Acidimicrobiales bacterium]
MRLGLAVVAMVVGGGCKVDVAVGIEADRSGAGRVTVTAQLDRAAVQRAGDLSTQLRTGDLVAAGWDVDPPKPVAQGGVQLVATRPFRDPAEAERILQTITGANGPVRGFTLTSKRSYFSTETTLRGVVDLTAGIEAFTDADLQAKLGGVPLGLTAPQLEREALAPLDQIFGLQVAVSMPGDVTANTPTVTDDDAVWPVRLGQEVAIEAVSTTSNRTNIAFLVVAAVAALGFLSTSGLAIVRRRGRR